MKALFEGCKIAMLQEEEVLDQHAVFKQEGMTELVERVYLILAD